MSDETSEEDDIAPGEAQRARYSATTPARGLPAFLWFATAGARDDQIFPIADIRRMSPPAHVDGPAHIHLASGVVIVLHGHNLRRVLYRIALRRCSALHELANGETPDEGEPVIRRMEFKDVAETLALFQTAH